MSFSKHIILIRPAISDSDALDLINHLDKNLSAFHNDAVSDSGTSSVDSKAWGAQINFSD